jgi:hypothetical protein
MQVGNASGAHSGKRPARPFHPPGQPAPPAGKGSSDDASPKPLATLTPSDRSFVRAVTGVDVQAGKPIPLLANEIALDRQRGVLPEGHPVDVAYVEQLSARQSSRGGRRAEAVLTEQQLTTALNYLRRHNGTAPVDFYA